MGYYFCEAIKWAPAQTFDAALNGKIPGAYINANSGAPGGGLSVKLRGVTSIFGNTQPLYVVDGVFMDNTATSGGLNAVAQAAAAVTHQHKITRVAALQICVQKIFKTEILKGASAAGNLRFKSCCRWCKSLLQQKRVAGKTKISFHRTLVLQKRGTFGVRQFTAETAGSLSSDPETSAALSQQFTEAKAAGKLYDYEKEIYGNTGFMRNSVLKRNRR